MNVSELIRGLTRSRNLKKQSLRLPRFQVIEIEALSIWKNLDHPSGIDVEEKTLHVFVGEEFESK